MAMRDMPGTPEEPSRQMGHKGLDTDRDTATGMPRSSGLGHAQGGHDPGDHGNPTSRIAGAARDRARTAFHEQQIKAADQLGGMAQALHRAAEQLAQENQGPVARLADTAAERVERFADTLRRRDVDDLLGQVEHYARRQPEVFIGGAFAVGFVLARFIKSSGDRRQRRSMGGSRSASHLAGGRQGIPDTEYGRGYGAYSGGYDTGMERPDIAGAYPSATGGVTSGAEFPSERSTAATADRGGDRRSASDVASVASIGATTASGSGAGAAGDNMGLEDRTDDSETGIGDRRVTENPPGVTGGGRPGTRR